MPLIQFSVNTQYENTVHIISQGMDFDGAFKLRHKFQKIPPPETEYTLKKVCIDGGGLVFSRNKYPTMWVGIHFPQIEDEIIAKDSDKKTVVDVNNGTRPHTNDHGILRFPVTSYPIDGINTDDNLDSNRPDRAASKVPAPPFYQHRADHHDMNIPLGRIRTSEGFIDCKLTPYDYQNSIATESVGANRKVRIKQLQVILEYK